MCVISLVEFDGRSVGEDIHIAEQLVRVFSVKDAVGDEHRR